MTLTKAVDLVNPEVMGNSIAATLKKGIKFAPFAKVDTTLVGIAGDTLTRPKYAYIGAAEDLVEGVAMDPKKMSMSTTKVTVKEVGISVEPTEKAILTNVDGTLENASDQLGLSIADKIEIDYLVELEKTLLVSDASPVTAASVIDAVDLFEDEDEGSYVLFINKKDYTAIRKEMIDGNTFLNKEQIADLLGLQAIVVTNRLDVGTAFVQKDGAVEIIYKKDVEVKKDEDILARTVVIAVNAYYALSLYNESGVVKIKATV